MNCCHIYSDNVLKVQLNFLVLMETILLKQKAIEVYTAIISKSNNIFSVSLVTANINNPLADDYQLHILSSLRNSDRSIIEKIANDNQLTIKEINNNIVIY